jgi:hypothetical protein
VLDTIFSATNALAMIGWAGLILLPGRRFVVQILARVLIPAAIAVIYIGLMVSHVGSSPEGGGFGSLAGIAALFSVDALLLAGWIHYLAFDLFVGSWEVTDSRKEGISHLLLVPCLVLTFMAGPAGLALYFAIKYGRRSLASEAAQPSQ